MIPCCGLVSQNKNRKKTDDMDFWQYIRHRRMLAESILDKPKIDLDPAVWTKNAKGEYIPTI